VRGSSSPRISDEGTMAYLVTFDTGYTMIMLDSSGPITEQERAVMKRIGGRVDLARVTYQGFFMAPLQIEQTLPLVELFNPDVFLPNHHDDSGGARPDMMTEPLFMAIREILPATRSIAPLYHTPVCINVRTKDIFIGETYTHPGNRRRAQ